jgi:hypothetical protein
MRHPPSSPIYRRCLMCELPFRVWRCELLRNRAKFCSVRSYSASRRAFSNAFADGRLELILAQERERAKTPARPEKRQTPGHLEILRQNERTGGPPKERACLPRLTSSKNRSSHEPLRNQEPKKPSKRRTSASQSNASHNTCISAAGDGSVMNSRATGPS